MIEVTITKMPSKEYQFKVDDRVWTSLAGVSLSCAMGEFITKYKLFGVPVKIHYEGHNNGRYR